MTEFCRQFRTEEHFYCLRCTRHLVSIPGRWSEVVTIGAEPVRYPRPGRPLLGMHSPEQIARYNKMAQARSLEYAARIEEERLEKEKRLLETETLAET